MKAKEYAENILKHDGTKYFEQSIRECFSLFVKEVEQLSKDRNVKSNSGVAGVLRELNDKWNATARIVNQKNSFGVDVMKINGFRTALENGAPGTKELMKEYLGGRKC